MITSAVLEISLTVLAAVYFFLPAAVANTAPIFAARIPALKKFDQPADFGLTFRGHRVLGDHKTIRGFVAGIIMAIIIVCIQKILFVNFDFLKIISFIDYSLVNPVIVGFLFGFGALFGDSVKSFFKRQVGVPSGKSWFPFDQIDYIIGGLLFISFYIALPTKIYVYIFIIFFVMHLLFTYVGYLLGLKKDPI